VAGTVVEIHLYPTVGAPATTLLAVEAVVGAGLTGDQRRRPTRQVTVLALEDWQRALDEIGADLPPCARRANVVVSGIDLPATVGQRLRLGEVELQIHGETKPCDQMDAAEQGLREALVPSLRGGVHGSIEIGGALRVGDEVRLSESEPQMSTNG